MKVILKFDYHTNIIYIPDGYIRDLTEVHLNFFEWLSEQTECCIYKNDMCGLSYDENDFLRYINEEVLEGTSEKAYFVKNSTNGKGTELVLKF